MHFPIADARALEVRIFDAIIDAVAENILSYIAAVGQAEPR